jgi:single-strand DNA-binding protein
VSATNINRVVLTGNLTRDPELRATPSGTSVCSLRLASNTRRKTSDGWVDKPNYVSVTVWGAQGENCARFLAKGRPVGIDGRLEWREWTGQDGAKREALEIVADAVQFLGTRDTNNGDTPPTADHDDEAAAVGAGRDDEDDIPF